VVTRRLVDAFLALLLLCATAPLFVAAAIGIRLSSSGPILYRTTRVGLHGDPLTLHKFRTMSMHPPSSGPAITGQNDPRVFPFGAWLRRTKIDELPQLFDVLRGKMAIVGPRPEDPEIVARFYSNRQKQTLAVLPGLTSPGALFNYAHAGDYLGCNVEHDYAQKLLPVKLELELAYVQNRSWAYDVRVILRTVSTIARNWLASNDSPSRRSCINFAGKCICHLIRGTQIHRVDRETSKVVTDDVAD
jgi:lipopolysaccharide/colanic/teichoic acid biosynthesis glycosyltransferase